MISFKLLVRTFGILLIPIVLHGILNLSVFSLTERAFLSTTYMSQYFVSVSVVLFMLISDKDNKGRPVWVYLGLTALKLVFLFGYMYPVLKDLDQAYLYHFLTLTTVMLFLELALLSKTLKLA